MKMVGDRREIAGRKKESASAQGARCIRYEGSNVVGGVRIRRVSRGKDYFFFFFLIDLLRPFSSTVAVSPGPSFVRSIRLFSSLSLSSFRAFSPSIRSLCIRENVCEMYRGRVCARSQTCISVHVTRARARRSAIVIKEDTNWR